MTFSYLIYIGNTTPTKPQQGLFWLRCSTGEVLYRLESQWYTIAGGEVVTAYKDGYAWKTAVVQAGAPTTSPGLIWISSTLNQAFIYITKWTPFVGG